MPYDDEGRFIYPVPARKPKSKDAAPRKRKKPESKPVAEASDHPASSLELIVLSAPSEMLSPELEPLIIGPEPEEIVDEPVIIPFKRLNSVEPVQLTQPLAEHDLALLWNAQKWLESLRLETTEGQPVEVIYRGRWSGGFGPDFKGALVSIGGVLRQGDIELHLQSSGWAAHGHQHDPRYNNVILQVVLETDTREAASTSNGSRPALLALLPCFKTEAALLEALELAKQSGTRLGSLSESPGLCCKHVAEYRPDLGKVLEIIEQLGQKRFAERSLRYEADFAAYPENGYLQAFWAGLLEALGYSQNKAPFRKLAAALPFAMVLDLETRARKRAEPFDERVLTLEAALLGAAGLLPGQRRVKPQNAGQMALFNSGEAIEPLEDWAAGVYVDELERRWQWLEREIKAGATFTPLSQSDWTFARLRPPNHPARRIAGLARFIARLPASSEAEILEWLTGKLLAGSPEEQCPQLNAAFRIALDDYASESGQFWVRRFDFAPRAIMAGEDARGAGVDLIGLDRAADITVNVVLPFLYAYACDQRNLELESRVQTAYRAHSKLGTNELVENVARQVFRPWLEKPGEVILSGKPVKKLTVGRLIETACRQQGLIYLHHHFCATQDYATCPLAAHLD